MTISKNVTAKKYTQDENKKQEALQRQGITVKEQQ